MWGGKQNLMYDYISYAIPADDEVARAVEDI